MNSFRSVERAIGHEIERQTRALDAGEPLVQETRGWDDDRGVTYRMRVKESSDDYRYFPEPDLPPLRVDPAWLDDDPGVAAGAAGGPAGALRRRRSGCRPTTPRVLVARPGATALFEAALAADPALPAKRVANWVTGEYLRLAKGEAGAAPSAAGRAGASWPRSSRLVETGRALRHQRQGGLRAARRAPGEPVAELVAEAGLRQISDDGGAARGRRRSVLAANPAAVADVRAGKAQAIGFLTGQVMKADARPGERGAGRRGCCARRSERRG